MGMAIGTAKHGYRKPGSGIDATIAYSCADGSLVVASFEPRTGRVLLTVGSWRVLLPAARAASGAKYSNGKITFWTMGNDARLIRGGKELVCRAEKGD